MYGVIPILHHPICNLSSKLRLSLRTCTRKRRETHDASNLLSFNPSLLHTFRYQLPYDFGRAIRSNFLEIKHTRAMESKTDHSFPRHRIENDVRKDSNTD
jgi:hypothetical protein